MCMKFRNIFEYKVEYLSLIISEIIYSERAHYLKRLKDLASEHHSVKQRFKRFSKTLLKSAGALLLSYFSMNLGNIELEKSPLLVWFVILRTVLLIHWLLITSIPVAICTFWHKIQTPLSLKQKNNFLNFFYCSSEMCMKFRTFWI